MIEIDGSQKSGSGTILRLSVALAAITQQSMHIINIRQNRPQPGLKHQHLEAVLTAAKLCNAKVEGAKLGAKELWFTPQQIRGGSIEATIETAGSIPMLLLATLPICLFAETPVRLHVAKGGTDTTHAPTINYLRNVFLPTLKRIGIEAEIVVEKYGYYPKGMGKATMTVKPNRKLIPIQLENYGKLKNIKGVSVCTFLADRQVAQRQAKTAKEYLAQNGYITNIQVVNDESNPIQKGSSIVLWAVTDTGIILGADAIGELHKMAEAVGKEAAQKLIAELHSKPTVDVFLADMLIPYIALAKGKSAFLVRTISDHIESNIWLMEKMLKVKFTVQKVKNLYRIEKS
ncbi:MAG TPA: RNA 3'-terminal phosphate cyclase [Candidatus Deferrimicrobiaceae bacterium]|nr:RNA 3'-terminal phosphate cyclase [Candidatus Deferrimicrobiaceae bacterium]